MAWIERLLATSMGVLGWSEEEFWNSDVRTLTAALEVRHGIMEEEAKLSWTQARWQVAVLLAPYNKGQMVEPSKLMPFPWEPKVETGTRPEDYVKVKNRLGARI